MLAQLLNIAGFGRVEGLWGPGLVDQSFASLSYGACWRSISNDELVFLLPPLCRPSRSDDIDAGVTDRIRQRVNHTVRAVLQHPHLKETTRSAALELLRRSRAAPTFFQHEARQPPEAPLDWPPTQVAISDLFCRLAAMDRMLYDSQSSTDGSELPLLETVEIPDVLLAAIHTRINGAYVYPSAAYAHELLSVGAWLGTVLSGRPALLPIGIAETLLDYMDGHVPERDKIEQRVQDIIICYADLVGGRRRLYATAEKTLTKGPQIFKPLRPATPATISECDVWQPELLRYVSNFLAGGETSNS